MNARPEPHDWIRRLAPYVPGKAVGPKPGPVEKLSANESPFGPSPAAVAAYRALADRLWVYPKGDPAGLRQAIADRHRLPAEQIVCGNGSDELLTLLAQAYAGPGTDIVHARAGFSLYPILAAAVGARSVPVANAADLSLDPETVLAAVTDQTRIVFLDNPNNPTGRYMPADAVRRLHAGLPDHVLLVLDAAYAESVTAPDYEAGARLVAEADNVVMTRTFSKLYGLAALRLGWAFGPPAIIDVLNRLRPPFNANAAAVAAGEAAVADQAWLAEVQAKTAQARQALTAELAAMGLRPVPSQTNFVLVRFGTASLAQGALDHLADNGVLVRHLTGQGLDDALRITLGRPDQMNAVTSLLSAFMRAHAAA